MRLTKRCPKKPEKSRFPSRKGDGPGRKFHSPTGNAPPRRQEAEGRPARKPDAPIRRAEPPREIRTKRMRRPPARAPPYRPPGGTPHGTPPARKPDSRRPETTGSPDERLKPTDRTTGRMTCRNAAAPKRRAGRPLPERRPARRYPDAAGTTSPFRPFSVRPSP